MLKKFANWLRTAKLYKQIILCLVVFAILCVMIYYIIYVLVALFFILLFIFSLPVLVLAILLFLHH